MSVKQTLVIIFFMMFIVNFIPRANASLVELEFSNGATVSFDDTVSYNVISDSGKDWEKRIRNYNSVRTIVSHPDNVFDSVTHWSTQSYESLGLFENDSFSAFSRDNSPYSFRINQIWTKQGIDFITSDIVSSLVDVIGVDNLFNFRAKETNFGSGFNLNISESIILTSVTVTPNPVPVPAAVWLFGSAIMGLIARRKLGGAK